MVVASPVCLPASWRRQGSHNRHAGRVLFGKSCDRQDGVDKVAYRALGITTACAVQGFIRERMQAGYDPEYLRQIFDFIVYTISCMEAPARRESTQKAGLLRQKVLHPDLLQVIRLRNVSECGALPHSKALHCSDGASQSVIAPHRTASFRLHA